MSEPYYRSSRNSNYVYSEQYQKRVDGNYIYDTYLDTRYDSINTLSGVTNPHYKRQIKKHLQAGTELSASQVRYDLKASNLKEVLNHNWQKGRYKGSLTEELSCNGDYFNVIPWHDNSDPSLVTKADNQAKTNYISEANEARQVLQSGELIGEFAELVRQVKSPGKSLKDGLSSYVRTVRNRTQRRSVRRLPRHRRGDEQLKILSDTWLEYKFGWAPLISEIDDVKDYINEEDPFDRAAYQSIQGVGRIEDSSWNPNGATRINRSKSLPGTQARIRDSVKVLVIYRGQVNMSSSAAGYISEKVGFAPDQWIPTAWELLPYSFLADYFANIGDIIYAAAFPRSLLPWTMKTTVIESTSKFVDTRPEWYFGLSGDSYFSLWTNDRQRISLGRASTFVKRVHRTPYSGSFVPSLEFSIPGSGTKWLNMAALFAGSRYVQKLLK